MKIENFNLVGRVDGVSKNNNVKSTQSKSSETVGADRATLSDGAQLMMKAMESLKDTPEVREERLQEVRDQIINGQYQVQYGELAKRLASKNWL